MRASSQSPLRVRLERESAPARLMTVAGVFYEGGCHAAASVRSAIHVVISDANHPRAFCDKIRRRGNLPARSSRQRVVRDSPVRRRTSGSLRNRSGDVSISTETSVPQHAPCAPFWFQLIMGAANLPATRSMRLKMSMFRRGSGRQKFMRSWFCRFAAQDSHFCSGGSCAQVLPIVAAAKVRLS